MLPPLSPSTTDTSVSTRLALSLCLSSSCIMSTHCPCPPVFGATRLSSNHPPPTLHAGPTHQMTCVGGCEVVSGWPVGRPIPVAAGMGMGYPRVGFGQPTQKPIPLGCASNFYDNDIQCLNFLTTMVFSASIFQRQWYSVPDSCRAEIQ